MIATIVFSDESAQQNLNSLTLVKNHKSQFKNPRVMEFTDMEKLRNKLKSFQYLLYPLDYLLVEFNGKIYDATNFNSEDSKKLMRKIDEWIDIHYMKESIL